MEERKRPDRLLDPTPSRTIVRYILYIVFLIFISGIIVLFLQSDYNFITILDFLSKKENYIYFISAIVAVCSSYLGALLFSISEERYHSLRLKYILSLFDKEYIETLISDLEFFRGRHYRDYDITIKFEKVGRRKDIILVRRKDSYRKKIVSRDISLRIMRIQSDNDVNEYGNLKKELSTVFEKYEVFQTIDERSLNEEVIKDPLYDNLFHIRSPVVEQTEIINLTTIKDDPLHLQGHIPPAIDLTDNVRIDIDHSWPMETDSFYSIILEFPCKGISVHVDYSDVADILDLTVEDYLSSRVGAPVSHADGDGVKTFSHGGWHPAKSNIILVWWRK